MKVLPLFITIFIAMSGCILLSNIAFRYAESLKTPLHSVNTHALGNFDDYHQYMMIIRFGRTGRLLYHNAYSEENIPDVLLQPFYTIAGLLSRPFSVSSYGVYFILRLASLSVLFYCVYRLILHIFQSESARILAAVFYFSATGWWYFNSFYPLQIQKHILNYANFDIFLKYFVIPPHHSVAIALCILVILVRSGRRNTRSLLITACCLIVLNFIHPYILYIFWLILGIDVCIQGAMQKKFWTSQFRDLAVISLYTLPFVLYTVYIHGFVLRWEIGNAGILTYLPRAETLAEYLQALGPMLIPAILVFTMPGLYGRPVIRLLLLWAFVPLGLFFLPDFHIPFNTWRLFQIYQQIPLSILAAAAIYEIVGRLRGRKMFLICAGILTLTYGGISLYYSAYGMIRAPVVPYLNLYIPDDLLETYSFLSKHTPAHSVVIAGGIVSNMLPSYTENHVVIGHNGDNRNFLAKQKEIGRFLGNTIPPDEVRQFLSKFRASYIIFGIDAPPFADTQYKSLPYLKEIYRLNGISVVEVL